MGTLDHERGTSEKVGVVLWLLDRLDERAAPADRARLLRLRGEAEAARLHGRRAAELLAAGRPASEQSSMAKLAVAVLMQRVAAYAVELLGPAALVEEGTGTLGGRVAAFHRAAVATTISGGAAEVQRLVIARRGLGCPA
jgi:3-oxocholest-4-en-26-oyl-CoA dehydrogenase alpha subunit